MRRAREDVAGLTQQQVVTVLATCMPLDDSTISRLEARTEIPNRSNVRRTAVALLEIYGLDPEPFGLSADELPGGLRDLIVSAMCACTRSDFGDIEHAEVIELEPRVPAEVAAAKRRHPSTVAGVEWGGKRRKAVS